MDIIALRGLTRYGQNKIKEHGELWQIIEIRNHVHALDNKRGFLLRSLKDNDIRWIATEHDRNFTWKNSRI